MKKTKFTKLLSLLVILCFMTVTNNNVLYAEAATPVSATFYLVDEDEVLKKFPNISIDGSYFSKVGVGQIYYPGTIFFNSQKTQKNIASDPSSGKYDWCHIVMYMGQYYVGASRNKALTDTNTNSNTSTGSKSPTKNSSNSNSGTSNSVKPITSPISNSGLSAVPVSSPTLNSGTVALPASGNGSSTTTNGTTSNTVHSLSREKILSLSSNAYPEGDSVIWKDFQKYKSDAADGIIPMSLINDKIYTSMNLPSESRSDMMISAWRDNGHSAGSTSSPDCKTLTNFGAIETTSGMTLPDSFNIYLGAIKMYAYSKSQQKWILIDSHPYPTGIYVYTLPWTTTKATKCTDVTYTSTYAKVKLTKDQLQNNCLHFWGSNVPLNKSDYLYFASSYDFWVDSSLTSKLTASSGIDAKDSTGSKVISQLFSSRGYSSKTYKKTVWGTTIPNDKYTTEWSQQLQALYNQ